MRPHDQNLTDALGVRADRVVACEPMTDQARIHNLASTGAELVAESMRKLTDRPMLVTVTVTHAGEILAEGYAGTDDYPEEDHDA
jgi:hypothetical protein